MAQPGRPIGPGLGGPGAGRKGRGTRAETDKGPPPTQGGPQAAQTGAHDPRPVGRARGEPWPPRAGQGDAAAAPPGGLPWPPRRAGGKADRPSAPGARDEAQGPEPPAAAAAMASGRPGGRERAPSQQTGRRARPAAGRLLAGVSYGAPHTNMSRRSPARRDNGPG